MLSPAAVGFISAWQISGKISPVQGNPVSFSGRNRSRGPSQRQQGCLTIYLPKEITWPRHPPLARWAPLMRSRWEHVWALDTLAVAQVEHSETRDNTKALTSHKFAQSHVHGTLVYFLYRSITDLALVASSPLRSAVLLSSATQKSRYPWDTHVMMNNLCNLLSLKCFHCVGNMPIGLSIILSSEYLVFCSPYRWGRCFCVSVACVPILLSLSIDDSRVVWTD